jgi:5-methylcytosine-specific restriction endonuclease McrA
MKVNSKREKKLFYGGNEWVKARTLFAAEWKANGKPCAYCGQPLRWEVKRAVTVGHKVPRKLRPDMALDPDNLVCMCSPCNSRRHFAQERTRVEASRSMQEVIDPR